MKSELLKFNKNGTFRIMQITDIQEIPAVSRDTVELLNKALDEAKPDLVVLTGDQIKGYGVTFKGKNFVQKVKNTLDIILEPIIKRNIPFVATFGNHDAQAGMSAKAQWDYYKTKPLCIGEDVEEIDGCGTFNIPILSSDGMRCAFNIYMIDSHGDAKGGGYEPVHESQIEWYKSKRDELKNQNGAYVPSLVFQHIPCHEFYNVLKMVKKGTKGAIQAFRTHKNEFYILDDDMIAHDGFFEEPPSISDINTGEFDAMNEKHDVLGIYVGHDHKNSFVGKYKGIDLGYTQSAGFNVYGAGVKRGVRVFDIKQDNTSEYKTHTLTFKELCKRKPSKPLIDFIYAHLPTTVDMAIPMIIKAVIAICGIIGAIILLTFIF